MVTMTCFHNIPVPCSNLTHGTLQSSFNARKKWIRRKLSKPRFTMGSHTRCWIEKSFFAAAMSLGEGQSFHQRVMREHLWPFQALRGPSSWARLSDNKPYIIINIYKDYTTARGCSSWWLRSCAGATSCLIIFVPGATDMLRLLRLLRAARTFSAISTWLPATSGLRMQCRSVWMALNADRNAIVGLHLLAAAFGSIPLGWPVLDRFLFIWLVTFPTYDAAIMRPFRPAPHLLGSPTVAAARVIWQKFFPRLEGFGVVNRLVFSTAFWAKSNKALRKVLVAYKAFWAAIRLLIPFGLRTGFAASLRSVWTAIIVFRIFCIHTRVNVFHPGGRNSFGKQKH